MKTTSRQLATILAALRYWQREGIMSGGHEHDIASDGDTLKPLTADEIDDLCEELNTQDAASPVSVDDTTHQLHDVLSGLLEDARSPLLEIRDAAVAYCAHMANRITPPVFSEEETARRQAIYDLHLTQYPQETVEVDDDFTIHDGDENGCFISAWIWIDFSETPLDKETCADKANPADDDDDLA